MPRQLLRQIAPRGRSTGRTETEPRGAPRSFVAELTPQEHHGPQILHGDSESQLGHEIATPGEWFDAKPTDEPPGDDHERQARPPREIAGLLLVPPEGQVPEPVTRAGDVADDGGQLPATSTAAIDVAIGRETRSAWVIVATATNTSPQRCRTPHHSPSMRRPIRAIVGRPARLRCRRRSPTPNAAERSRWTSGRVSTVRRSTGASRRCRTSAASIESGPPSLPLRRPSTIASTATIPSTPGPR